MAPFSNYISFFLLSTLLLPLQIIARDSQFFSKVPHLNNNNNVKETELPNKEEQVTKAEQRPVFIPETENSYGLYGHESESSKLPSTTSTNAARYTTTTNYQPYETEFQHTSKYPSKYNNDAFNTYQDEVSNTRLTGTGYSYNNRDAYEGNQNELSDTKYNHKYHYANDRYSYSNNNFNGAGDSYSYNKNAANNRHSGEKQGMSDTRFLEGGKYFYDIESEKYNPTLYSDSSRGVNTNTNWYNNGVSYYGNKGGYNGHQNQREFADEQDEFEP